MRAGALREISDEYYKLGIEIKEKTARREYLRTLLLKHFGEEENAEDFIPFEDRQLCVQKTTRENNTLTGNAVNIINNSRMFRKIKDELIETVNVVRTDRLEDMIKKDKLSSEQLERIYDTKKVTVLNVKIKDKVEYEEASSHRR